MLFFNSIFCSCHTTSYQAARYVTATASTHFKLNRIPAHLQNTSSVNRCHTPTLQC